jgi:hypothetical protein
MPSSKKRTIEADPIAEGIDYAKRVVARKIPACKFVRLALQRFLDDLKAAEAGRGPWRFDPDHAMAPIAVCERLPNIKGPQAGDPIRLMPWQRCLDGEPLRLHRAADRLPALLPGLHLGPARQRPEKTAPLVCGPIY